MARARSICAHSGCPSPAVGRYCPAHNQEYEARRGRTAARGYGSAHQRERERVRVLVEAGRAVCARCGQPIGPGEAWDLGHSDDRLSYRGPEHAAACNRAAGGRAAHLG